MNRNQRRMAAFNAGKASEAIEQTRFERRIVSTLSSCNQRVEKAVISPSLRDQKTTGSACLPEVAIYAAGHRKPTKSIYPAR
ncbi:transcriptional antitermination N peptide [Pantoea agglomerans]|uniref:transcriptional antitermination N peptide n=1 Tax=Enterobacter agglomerans TaxID=549 RepID=UPI00402641BC